MFVPRARERLGRLRNRQGFTHHNAVEHVAIHIGAIGPTDDAELGVDKGLSEVVHITKGREDSVKMDYLCNVDGAGRAIVECKFKDVPGEIGNFGYIVQFHGSLQRNNGLQLRTEPCTLPVYLQFVGGGGSADGKLLHEVIPGGGFALAHFKFKGAQRVPQS